VIVRGGGGGGGGGGSVFGRWSGRVGLKMDPCACPVAACGLVFPGVCFLGDGIPCNVFVTLVTATVVRPVGDALKLCGGALVPLVQSHGLLPIPLTVRAAGCFVRTQVACADRGFRRFLTVLGLRRWQFQLASGGCVNPATCANVTGCVLRRHAPAGEHTAHTALVLTHLRRVNAALGGCVNPHCAYKRIFLRVHTLRCVLADNQ